jgi:hypothetical protein
MITKGSARKNPLSRQPSGLDNPSGCADFQVGLRIHRNPPRFVAWFQYHEDQFVGRSAMLVPVSPILLLSSSGALLPTEEPDGSRSIGIVPPFRGEPAPPAWLRTRSQACARALTRHYIYEAYAGPQGKWLVRYLLLPEEDEGSREIEQAFLFSAEEEPKPLLLNPSEVQAGSRTAKWKQLAFRLVDRRDLRSAERKAVDGFLPTRSAVTPP